VREFLDKYINQKEGDIVDIDGKVLGKHNGIHHYTIGQRKGIGVAAAEPLYVVKLDPVMNRVVVGNRANAGCSECTVGRINWVSIDKPTTPIRTQVQVRYRSSPASVNAIPLGDSRVKLVFDEPQFGITPGQAAVFYDGDVVLGGGIIQGE
jgi:tRNA-uridine 2-sulfurtransferase